MELRVALRIFNSSNASSVFALKVTLLTVSVSCLSALLLMRFHWLILIIMIYAGVLAPVLYPVLYYRAPAVADRLERTKALLVAPKGSAKAGLLIGRRLAAVSPKGVWVGGLRTFERESVLIFFDFILRTVCSIVLARR